MNLPFLEFLNLSNNQIENINPLKEINSKNFNFLFIQNNQITDIQLFLDDDFPTFEILRIDNNNIDENSKKKLIDLYKKKNLILIINIDDIKKYSIDYKEDMTEIKVENQEEGDLMLKYIFINIPSNNRITNLKLSGNEIEDPSILNRIQFNCLDELDLSCNNIKNLKFLKKMKAQNLTKLFLDNNKINNISLLYNIKETFSSLEFLTFNDNQCSPKDYRYKNLEMKLKDQNIICKKNNK
jgi:Leucine-rich repeat (LRR) protein